MFVYGRSPLPKIGVLLTVLGVAGGIGFVMQQGDSAHLSAIYAETETAPDLQEIAPAPEVVAARTPDSLPEVDTVEPTATSLGLTNIRMTSSGNVDDVMMDDVDAAPILAENCDVTMDAIAGPAALVEVNLMAPCHANARVTIHHEGLMFSVVTDQSGSMTTMLPVLKQTSVAVAAFDDGTGAMATFDAPSLQHYDRVAVQWQGQSGLEVHAFEYGAVYNQPGHVWSGAPQDIARAAGGEGGFLMQLGDPDLDAPLLAEVYTFPSGATTRLGDVQMTVEAEITRTNCERDVVAQTMQFRPDQELSVQDLSLKMPTCQAIGEFLVLNNLLETVQLAQN